MSQSKRRPLKAAHCPEHLQGRARELWLEVVRQAPAGALIVSDGAGVGVLACALALHEQAAVKVQEYGGLVMSGTKAEINPWLIVQNQQAAVISKASRDLGLKFWRDTASVRGRPGKKEAQKAAAHEVGGRFATPAAPKLVVSN